MPVSLVPGKRRAIAISQRPPPQWTSRIRAPGSRSATSCGTAGQDLLEEHRDVLDGQPLDGLAVAVRARGARDAGPEHVRQVREVEAAHRGWRNWPPRYSGRSGSSRIAATSAGTRSRPSSAGSIRSWAVGAPGPAEDERRLGAGAPASSSAVSPAAPASRSSAEQPELQARRPRTTRDRSRRGSPPGRRSGRRGAWPHCGMQHRPAAGRGRAPDREWALASAAATVPSDRHATGAPRPGSGW